MLFFLSLALASSFPEYWFDDAALSVPAEIPIHYDAGKPFVWEIMPSAAKKGEVILSKRNELGLLSNFAATPFVLDQKSYASVEGFWQSLLFPEEPGSPYFDSKDPRALAPAGTYKYTRSQVTQMSALEAKFAGDAAFKAMETLKIDWVTYQGQKMTYLEKPGLKGLHYQLIERAMRAKLAQNPKVKAVLLKTLNLKLLPDHHGEPNAPEAFRYNEIWMRLRAELISK